MVASLRVSVSPGYGRLGVSMTSINLGDHREYLAAIKQPKLCEVRLGLKVAENR